jgi:hypothetical protein
MESRREPFISPNDARAIEVENGQEDDEGD